MVFVFGSNLSGIHGGGAARHAFLYLGAEMRIGEGPTGECYALPTKEANIADSRSLEDIKTSVLTFFDYAKAHPELDFQVTRIGCGLAGLLDQNIAPMFNEAPSNCLFDGAWVTYLPGKKFWGTF